MDDRGSRRRVVRPATAGRFLLRILGVLVALPCWLFWLLAVLLLPLSRLFVQLPLSLCSLGSVVASFVFAHSGEWGNAIEALAIGTASAVTLAVYTSLAERIDPNFSRPTSWTPWWWYF